MIDEPRARQLLQQAGLRRTTQRVAVLLMLSDPCGTATPDRDIEGVHLTARQIHAGLRAGATSIDLATVHRTVTRLAAAGLLHVTSTDSGVATYGLGGIPHHHTICTTCQVVADIPVKGLESALRPVFRATGYHSSETVITLHGPCPRCNPHPNQAAAGSRS